MSELNREEIIKALELIKNCRVYSYEGNGHAVSLSIQEILDTIKELIKEKDNLEYTLEGVMHFVDKWLDEEELEKDEVNRAIIMREKTLQTVEKLTREKESLREENDRLIERLEREAGTQYKLSEEIVNLRDDVKYNKAETVQDLLARAIDKSVCKDYGDGTERLFISIPDLRNIAEEMEGE